MIGVSPLGNGELGGLPRSGNNGPANDYFMVPLGLRHPRKFLMQAFTL
jgi:hypothetical protein